MNYDYEYFFSIFFLIKKYDLTYWPLRWGLTTLWWPELDAKVVIDLVCANNTPNRYYTPLLNDCKDLAHPVPGHKDQSCVQGGEQMRGQAC